MPAQPEFLCRRWVIEGRVQGVGFRWYVFDHARSLGVRGWVRNTREGFVEVVGLATAATIGRLDALLREGPPGSRITRVAVDDVRHESVDAKSFIVKH